MPIRALLYFAAYGRETPYYLAKLLIDNRDMYFLPTAMLSVSLRYEPWAKNTFGLRAAVRLVCDVRASRVKLRGHFRCR